MNITQFLKAAEREGFVSIVDLEEAVSYWQDIFGEVESDEENILNVILSELDTEGYIVYDETSPDFHDFLDALNAEGSHTIEAT